MEVSWKCQKEELINLLVSCTCTILFAFDKVTAYLSKEMCYFTASGVIHTRMRGSRQETL